MVEIRKAAKDGRISLKGFVKEGADYKVLEVDGLVILSQVKRMVESEEDAAYLDNLYRENEQLRNEIKSVQDFMTNLIVQLPPKVVKNIKVE